MRKVTTKIINKRDTGDFNTGRYKNVCCWDWYKVFKIKGKRWDYSLFFFFGGDFDSCHWFCSLSR